jgi:hypothetical protein
MMVSKVFYDAIAAAQTLDELFAADDVVTPAEILNRPVVILEAHPFIGKYSKECAACLIKMPDGVLRVFFAGEYAKRRPLVAARKNRLPMTMTLGTKRTLTGRTLYLFDGI